MSKVAIVTIISKNYGNRLQNYALQEVLKQMGVDVETIPMRAGKQSIKSDLKYLIKTLINCVGDYYPNVAWERFDKNITWGPYPVKGCENLLEKRYEYFIAGSDQIWNPLFDINSDRELLTFVPDEKRIAYAASIGLNEFPVEFLKHYSIEWNKFHAISVRESQAADIIQKSIGSRPKVVLDPTMLLTEQDWKKVMKENKFSRNFFVGYFLGGHKKEYDSYISNCKKEKNCEIIELTDEFGNIDEKIGPSEFLEIIYKSQGVFTDSFHGTVFALLFEKPFFVFERVSQKGYGNMNSRINTLMKTFDLQDHIVSNKMDFSFTKMEWNYSSVREILNEKRAEAKEYLIDAMSV